MFTADVARQITVADDLDARIEYSVKERKRNNGAYLRIYDTDTFIHTIKEELEKRGFINVSVPDICLSGDVYFEWEVK